MALNETLLAGGLGGLIAGLALSILIIGLIILLAVYVYTSLAFQTIARKLKHPYPWLAWIPIANFAMILQLGRFHWALIFLILIPIVGWAALAVLGIISMWRIYEKRKYPGALALIPLAGFIPVIGALASLANLIILGLVAWRD
jgi:hypothetical protein